MDNSTHNDDLLVRFLDGDLSTAEKKNVEQQLATDKVVQEQFDSLLLTKEAIRQYGLNQKVAGVHQQMMEEMQAPVKKINPVKKLVRLTAAVAAGIILLVGGFWLYNFYTLSGNKVFHSAYNTYEMPVARDANTHTTVAEKAYQQKNYAEVLRIHDAGEDKTIKGEFLAGAAALELNNNAKAITCFKEVLTLNRNQQSLTLQDEAEYYLSLSYILNGDYNNSLVLLKKIKEDPEHTYHGAVSKKLIRQVKMLKSR